MSYIPFVMMLPLFAIFIFIPYWTRKTESFGHTIPEKAYESKQLQKMRKTYAVEMIVWSALFALLYLVGMYLFETKEDTFGMIFTIMTFVYIIVGFVVYLKYHRQMKVLKVEKGWHEDVENKVLVDTTFRNQAYSFSVLWYLIPLGFILLTTFITFFNYDQIPNRIPMNYDLQGNVTNFTHKSGKSVLVAPMTQMMILFIFVFIHFVIHKSKQQVSTKNPEASLKQNIVFRKTWSWFNYIMGTVLIILFSGMQMMLMFDMFQSFMFPAFMIFVAFVLIAVIVLSIKVGQGGSRVKVQEDMDGDVIERDDDEHWKLGIFYFNPQDPALFVEKRFGVGWTNNFARPLSWVLLGLIILIPLSLIFFK